MRLLVISSILLLLTACAKPANPNNSPYPIYGSVTTVVNGVETSCESCAMFEINNNALRVTFSNNEVDECSGQGTLSYLSTESLVLPANIGESISWAGSVVGDNSSKSVFCFPDLLELNIQKTDTNLFQVDYNGKAISVKKIN